ncbi:FecR family protein [Bacteroides clarus]|uniref:Anti-sigma factor n=1 Tax=Bacteroides clarus TaxID=626929 RepID=A0A1Y3YM26_9BACE|nr:FecR domain-containing protein [Bacteroides clarus]OUN98923.1 anti-sigma factor [Bacteroides clarus]
MVKFGRNRKKVTAGQEERVWNRIDFLYSKLEEGNATEDELKQIDGISKIVMDVTGRSGKRKKETATPEELDELTRRDLEMLARTIGIEGMERRPNCPVGQVKQGKRLPFSRAMKYVGAGIAASLLLVLGISSYFDEKLTDGTDAMACHVIQCQNDSVLHLADGTVVHLAGGSNLSIAGDFGKKDRTVSLVGEAFFEVAKDKKKSFIVRTKEINAIVHGTSFNVTAYGGAVESRVAVRTGCVEVARGEQSFGKFHCGDRVVYDEAAGRAMHDKVNPDNIGAWTTGGFVLEDATVEELKIRVKNRFHRELVIEEGAIPADARINYCSYKPEQSGADCVMKNICTVYGTRYEISDNRIVVSR